MRRREFLWGMGGIAVYPAAARAQRPNLPVIGFLNPTLPQTNAARVSAFHRGLKDTGYIEHENVAIEYRWGEGQFHRLPELAAELVRRKVSVITTTGGPNSALAAMAATTTIPIVFAVATDPVGLGLVDSLSRPRGNLTGVSIFNTDLTSKRLGLLREMVPTTAFVAVLVNPASTVNTETTLNEFQSAARAIGLKFKIVRASSSRELDAVFEGFRADRPDAIFVGNEGFFITQRAQLSELAARQAIPAAYASREIVEVGGMMSYGTNIVESFYQTGLYTGRVLNGAKPGDLPVIQSTKFELVINLKATKALGLTVPSGVLAIADEVIE